MAFKLTVENIFYTYLAVLVVYFFVILHIYMSRRSINEFIGVHVDTLIRRYQNSVDLPLAVVY